MDPPAAGPGDAAGGSGWPAGAGQWHRVSPKYAWADLALNLLFDLILVAVFFVIMLSTGAEPPLWVVIVFPIGVVGLLVNSVLAFRRVKAIGYVLRDDDLLFRRGIMFERVIAVPYGRLQLVDVTRGPLLRALGLSTLKFVTASAATGVNLPGLPAEEAEALRDRLIDLAETRRSGL
ncbi:PH domain-containing protein [Leucobacter sp. CSA1]|uniref:PH domain-containing protein n=2 Tax=Leucobacter chromiisoli TaxID=2796471 RepID=A0A934Q748_9MICO|nr:PH domain-containing protein [Leucobacter chromiisoli]